MQAYKDQLIKISDYLSIQKFPVVKCILQIIGGKEQVEHTFGMHLIKQSVGVRSAESHSGNHLA